MTLKLAHVWQNPRCVHTSVNPSHWRNVKNNKIYSNITLLLINSKHACYALTLGNLLSTLKALRYNSYCNLEQNQVFINYLRHQVACHIQVFINILLRHQVICSGNLIIQLNSFYFIYICTFEAWQHSLSNGVSRRDYDGSKSWD